MIRIRIPQMLAAFLRFSRLLASRTDGTNHGRTPAASFKVDDLKKEFERLRHLGVEFTIEPMDAGPVRMAVLDDTCGNLIQLVEMAEGR